MRRDDDAVATVIGALIVLALLGLAIVYVNAIHVPRQGLALEVQAREEAEVQLAALAAAAADGDDASIVLPLVAERPLPPLLSGIILSPARQEGRLVYEPARANVTISHVTSAPASGVLAGDPTRVPLGGGLVRVYDLGNATAGAPLGSLQASVGGAYAEGATYLLEGGAVLVKRASGSALVAAPALTVDPGADASRTRVDWTVPLLTGAPQDLSGARRAQVALSPGPLASAGGGDAVQSVTIVVESTAAAAWRDALAQLVGARGNVTMSAVDDVGRVTATIGGAGATPSVELRLGASWQQVSFAGRSAG